MAPAPTLLPVDAPADAGLTPAAASIAGPSQLAATLSPRPALWAPVAPPPAVGGPWPTDKFGRFVLRTLPGERSLSFSGLDPGCSHSELARRQREFGVIGGRRINTALPLPKGSIPPSPPAALQAGRERPRTRKGGGAAGDLGLPGSPSVAGPQAAITPAEVRSLSGPAFSAAIMDASDLDGFFNLDDPDTLAVLAEPQVQQMVQSAQELLAGDALAAAHKLDQALYYLRAAAYVEFYSEAVAYSPGLHASVKALLRAISESPSFLADGFLAPRAEWCVQVGSWEALPELLTPALTIFRRYLQKTPAVQSAYLEQNSIYDLFTACYRNVEFDERWVGQYTPEFLQVMEDYAVHFIPSTDLDYLPSNAVFVLGHLRSSEAVAAYQGRGHQLLTEAYYARSVESASYLEVLATLELAPFNSRLADGTPVDVAGYRQQLERQIFSHDYTYDSGAMVFHTPLSEATAGRLYDALHEVKSQFHRVTQALRPRTADPNTDLDLRIYGTRADYEHYQRFLYNLDTDNGGIYIEGRGTFYTYERTPAESIYTMEELTRHEYTHYLDGYYLITPNFGEAPFYADDRLTWHSEGLAEFLAGSRRIEGVPMRQKMLNKAGTGSVRYTIAQIIGATYDSGFGFYPNAAMFFQFLHERHPEKLWPYFRSLYENDFDGYVALTQPWRSDAALQAEYTAFLDQAFADFASGTRQSAESVSTAYRPAVLPAVFLDEVGSSIAAVAGAGTISPLSPARYRFQRELRVTATGADETTPERFESVLEDLLRTELVTLTPVAPTFATTTAWYELLSINGSTASARLTFEGWYRRSDAPDADLSATALDFAATYEDSAPEVQELRITNAGATPLLIESFSLTGEGAAFFTLLPVEWPLSVGAGQTVVLQVRLNPALLEQAAGGLHQAALTLHSSNGHSSAITVHLRATKPKRIYVDAAGGDEGDGSSWDSPFRSLSAALTAATDASEVINLATGEYLGSFHLHGTQRIRGGFPGAARAQGAARDIASPEEFSTVLRLPPGGTGRVLDLSGCASPVVEGLRITGGHLPGASDSGAGLLIDSITGTATIQHCRVEQNMAGKGGGGASISGSRVKISDTTFAANTARSGAGLLASSDADVTLQRCDLLANHALDQGGGFYTDGKVTAQQVRMVSNTSANGAAFCADRTGEVTFHGCLIVGNSANAYYGGGIVQLGAQLTAEQCVFLGNKDSSVSNGLSSYTHGILRLRNCIFAGHRYGSITMLYGQPADLQVDNCLFFNSGSDLYQTPDGEFFGAPALNALSASFRNAQSGDPRWATGPLLSVATPGVYDATSNTTVFTLQGSPLQPNALRGAVLARFGEYALVETNTASSLTLYGRQDGGTSFRVLDLHLTAASPAIDAGLASEDPTDPDGYPRGAGRGTDIGLYEYIPLVAGAFPATEVTGTSATIHATLETYGVASQAYFEYGLTEAYGDRTFAEDVPDSGDASGALAGLNPGATYHYRLVWSTSRGLQYGPDQILTTGAGIRVQDDLFSLHGPKAYTLSVLANDFSDSPASLKIVSITPATAGKVAIKGKTVIYTPGAAFAGLDTFTYTATSASGATATATVTVRDVARLAAGRHAGLLTVAGDPTLAGRVQVTASRGGPFTGRLEWCDLVYPLAGSFPGNKFLHTFKPAGQQPVRLTLTLDPQSGSLTSLLEQGSVSVTTALDRCLETRDATALAGSYTMRLVPASVAGGAAPQAPGYGTMVVSRAGTLTLTATLPDGSPVLASAFLTKQGRVPLYLRLYVKRPHIYGHVCGTAQFAGMDQLQPATGSLAWRKPSLAGGKFFSSGFDTQLDLTARPYRTSKPVKPLVGLPSLANFSLALPAGADPLTKMVSLSAAGAPEILNRASDRLTLRFYPTNGRVSGTFYDMATRKLRRLNGVVFQEENIASGLCLDYQVPLPFALNLLQSLP